MMGISYDTLLDRDLRFYYNCVEGYISRREIAMNDMQSVGHIISSKIAEAVWGSHSFSNPLDTIRLRDESPNDKVLKTLKAKGLI